VSAWSNQLRSANGVHPFARYAGLTVQR
jgi:hypothetical protein